MELKGKDGNGEFAKEKEDEASDGVGVFDELKVEFSFFDLAHEDGFGRL